MYTSTTRQSHIAMELLEDDNDEKVKLESIEYAMDTYLEYDQNEDKLNTVARGKFKENILLLNSNKKDVGQYEEDINMDCKNEELDNVLCEMKSKNSEQEIKVYEEPVNT